MGYCKEQQELSFNNLMSEIEIEHNAVNIESPSTDDYKKRRSRVNKAIREANERHVESYNSVLGYII